MDRDSKFPVTRETLFQAGSISKTVTAYAALKLAELNKIGLEENNNGIHPEAGKLSSTFSSSKLKNILRFSVVAFNIILIDLEELLKEQGYRHD